MSTTDAPAHAPGPRTSRPALEVSHVDVSYAVKGREVRAVRDVSFSIARNESYGLVGESGSGKSTVALAVTRYMPRNGRVSAGSIEVDGKDLLAMSPAALRELRTRTVSVVYQEPGRALNPSMRVGRQVAEVFELAGADRRSARERAEAMLGRVQIADPGRVMGAYPHQLSGGMLQRVVLAMAIASDPALLVLDEPTTALDVTVEAEMLELVSELRRELDTSLLFISHNLAVVARMCDRVGVLYAGEVVEEGPARELFAQPRHPYTVGLLRCVPDPSARKGDGGLDTIPGFMPPPGAVAVGCVFAPRCALADDRCRTLAPELRDVGAHRSSRCHHAERAAELPRAERSPTGRARAVPGAVRGAGADGAAGTREPVLRVRALSTTYRSRGVAVRALAAVDLDLYAGETLGLVGESGSGKTTLARALLGLVAPDDGSVVELDRVALPADARRRAPAQLKALQMVFQDPDSALNRRWSVRRLVARPVRKLAGLTGAALADRVADLVAAVRMEHRHLALRPGQLSGGLKQRVAVARAFGGEPRVLVCDEPTSALDVSVQAAILNLLVDLQVREQVTYVLISHDLAVVRYLADRIAVLYLGRVMEIGPADTVFSGPHHPYTEALLSAITRLEGAADSRIRLEGEIPSAASPPGGCAFHTRCPVRLASGVCESVEPPLASVGGGHEIRCHIPVGELRRLQSGERDGDPVVAGATWRHPSGAT
ncbi:MAG TPA: ABC transporter ATP-binding protein [Acidimicrobiales bacterium]|nr:ABC transporter ATP-binding protein [Acidimicrobiales bacterium]